MTYTAGYSPTGLIREALSKKSDRALSALETRTCHSWKMALDRSQVLPETMDLPQALNLYIRTANGARVTDLDGNAFIDLSMGCGAQILGHNHAATRDAVLAQAARGLNFGLPGADHLELARLIQAAAPANERVLLCNAPAEALAAACAAVRAVTGRSEIAGFAQGGPGSGSGSDSGARTITALPYGETAALDIIAARRADLAAVVVEPMQAANPGLSHVSWLQTLIEACNAWAVPVIFDESFTGFRLAFGGAQELLGLIPDLAVYGRAVGGGLPLAALAGRADIMAAIGRTENISGEGTGNPVSIAAGLATLRELHRDRAVIYPKLNAAGAALAEDFNRFCAEERLGVTMHAVGSIFRITFEQPAAENAFYLFALSRSIFINASRRGFLSAAHRSADMDYIVSALSESLRDVRDDGLFLGSEVVPRTRFPAPGAVGTPPHAARGNA